MAWQLVDLVDTFAVSEGAGADGVCEVTFAEVPPGYLWRVRTINVSCASSTDTTAVCYLGDAFPQNLRSGSNNGNQDTADGWLIVPPTRYLRVRWTGASAGAVGVAAIQYELLEQVTGSEARPLFGR